MITVGKIFMKIHFQENGVYLFYLAMFKQLYHPDAKDMTCMTNIHIYMAHHNLRHHIQYI